MRLTKRLQKVADYVPTNSIVADIGTDHGYIPKHLMDNEISKLVIATDISEGSLNKTRSYVEDENLSDTIQTRLGNGLEPIKPYEVDTVVIAGMGGVLIAEILDKERSKAETYLNFILQPMVGAKELREYLLNNGFKIKDENLVREDGKYYEIILAENGLDIPRTDVELELGPILMEKREPLWEEFVQWKIATLEAIKIGLKGQTTEKSVNRYKEIETLLKEYREVLQE
ncbi:MAG: class I SAM-dependent methyltransferase [Gudongella sp.]|nr:class I SAM-dependent methyltransferase [Gudongella sp.]